MVRMVRTRRRRPNGLRTSGHVQQRNPRSARTAGRVTRDRRSGPGPAMRLSELGARGREDSQRVLGFDELADIGIEDARLGEAIGNGDPVMGYA